MERMRIAELLEPFFADCGDQRLRSEDFQNISMYIDLLLRWNARINLTAIRDPEEIVTRHFGESFFAAHHLFPRDLADDDGQGNMHPAPVQKVSYQGAASAAPIPADKQNRASALKLPTRLADLGSGAGFPGIPIKLWSADIELTLIESNQKKATFLREVVRTLGLGGTTVQNARAETMPAGTFDVVTLRAVEKFAHVLPLAARSLAPSGSLAILISSVQFDAARSALPGFAWDFNLSIPLSKSRVLAIGHRNQ